MYTQNVECFRGDKHNGADGEEAERERRGGGGDATRTRGKRFDSNSGPARRETLKPE